ncbi:MAG: hypothetical protein AAFQ43_00250 [Bacteroidota bacterium]
MPLSRTPATSTGPGPLSPRARATLRKTIAYIASQAGAGSSPAPDDGRTVDLGGGRSPRIGPGTNQAVDATARQELGADLSGVRPTPVMQGPGARVADLSGVAPSATGAAASGVTDRRGTPLASIGAGDVEFTAERLSPYDAARVDTTARQRPTAPTSRLAQLLQLAGAGAQLGGAIVGGDVGMGVASGGAGLASGARQAADEEQALFQLEQQAFDEWMADATDWNRRVSLTEVGAQETERRQTTRDMQQRKWDEEDLAARIGDQQIRAQWAEQGRRQRHQLDMVADTADDALKAGDVDGYVTLMAPFVGAEVARGIGTEVKAALDQAKSVQDQKIALERGRLAVAQRNAATNEARLQWQRSRPQGSGRSSGGRSRTDEVEAWANGEFNAAHRRYITAAGESRTTAGKDRARQIYEEEMAMIREEADRRMGTPEGGGASGDGALSGPQFLESLRLMYRSDDGAGEVDDDFIDELVGMEDEGLIPPGTADGAYLQQLFPNYNPQGPAYIGNR